MTTGPELDEEHPDPEIQLIASRLEAVGELLQRISDEVGQGTVRGADSVIERRRPELYAAMEALGETVYHFTESRPTPERLAAVQRLVIGRLQEYSQSSPITLYGSQGKRSRMSYFEVVEHVRASRASGADVRSRAFDDYYVRTRIGQAFLNRLRLFNIRLASEIAQCRATRDPKVNVISLQYVGGDELLALANDPASFEGLEVTCLDDNRLAVRHAEQTLRPRFNSRIQILMADPARALEGPACPSGSACIVYAISLLEQLPSRRVIRILRGADRALMPGGVLLMGCTSGEVPVAELLLRDWLLGWDWKYRSESEWRELFAQTPFGLGCLTFEYEPLGVSALIRVEKDC